jgi:hypothetical protein
MRQNTTVKSLTIAIILFALLTFVLAVTTYVYFKKFLDEQKRADERTREMAAVTQQRDQAIEERIRLQAVIGGDDTKTVSEVEQDAGALFAERFPTYDANEKLLTLIDLLAETIEAKDKTMLAAEEMRKKDVAAKDVDLKKQEEVAKQAADAQKKIEEDAKTAEAKYAEERAAFEKKRDELSKEKDEALGKQNDRDKILEEIANAAKFLSPEGVKKFTAATDSGGKLAVVFGELRSRDATIKQLNEMLTRLHAAGKEVQAAVLAATPKDDKIEGFDGRVALVDEAERTVVLSCPTTRGLRPGLVLYVYDADDVSPRLGSRKASVEIIAIDGPSTARARIRGDAVRNPVLAGDGVASNLWIPGFSPEIVILGYVTLDDDAKQDTERLKTLLQSVGGRIVDTVTPLTTMVVDAGKPKPVAGVDGLPKGWRDADNKRYDLQLKQARDLGVRIVGIDAVLDMLGLQREALAAGRLPPRGGRTVSSGEGDVAY